MPVLYYLAGLTCNEETFTIKAGAQRLAAQHGLMLVAPDTSPRQRLPGDDASWDFGIGAGFYVDATAGAVAAHYRMYSYVTAELPDLVQRQLSRRQPTDNPSWAIRWVATARSCAHCAIPALPLGVGVRAHLAPHRCPWGEKAFSGYLGADRAAWRDYDATALVERRPFGAEILIDQGTADKFLAEQLRPHFLRPRARKPVNRCACACRPATTTAITSSRLSCPNTSRGMPRSRHAVAITVPSRAVSSRNSPASRCVTRPGSPAPITRPSTLVTAASSPMVPVQNISSAR